MAKKKKKNRKNPGGYKSTVSPKKNLKHNKAGKEHSPGKFKLKRFVIGLSAAVIIGAALIAYFTLQDTHTVHPRNKPVKAASSVNKTKSESNSKMEKGKPENNTSATAPVIQFEKIEHDYGTIQKGSDGTCEFVFKNTGQEPLVLNNVKSSCGCTVPTWPRQPVLAGNSAVIKVVYDTKRVGTINKSITVNSNATNSMIRLKIKGKVVTNQ